MTRHRPPPPGPDRDWHALADPLPARALDADPDEVTIRVRTCPDGTRCAIVIASVRFDRAADLRAVARRLDAAADALDERSP